MNKFLSHGSFQPSIPMASGNDITSSAQNAYDDNKKNTQAAEERQNIIEDFCSYTTLHGFHFTLKTTYRNRRLIWTLLLIGAFALFFYQFSRKLSKLRANDVVISKSVDFSRALTFPAVTICNQNMMRKSHIIGTIAQEYLDQLDFAKFAYSGQKHKDVPSFDIWKTLLKAGHQMKDMIQYCEFSGVNCAEMNYGFTPTTPSAFHGLCYTFPGNRSGLKKVGDGYFQGLHLRLNAEPYEYYGPYSYDTTGFKIVIHEPGTDHGIDSQGYDISPGFATSIRMKKKKTIHKPSPYPSNCGSKKLETFERYTQKSCLKECWSKAVVKECGCRVIGMVYKGIEDVRFCNTSEMENCIRGQASQNIMQNSKSCQCPKECESINYSIQMSMAYYPSETLMDTLIPLVQKITRFNVSTPEGKEKLKVEARKCFASVAIFFEDLSTDVIEEKVNYDLSDFASDMGGNMGLFLGCSLLTIFEFLDLIIMLCLNRKNHR